MATVLKQVTTYLDQRGWRYHIEPNSSRILTGVQAQNVERFLIVIQIKDEGNVLSLIAPQFLMVETHRYKRVLFQTLLTIASEVKLLRWAYDPREGEVHASIHLLLADTPLSERQFNRALETLIQLVDEVAMPRLQKVLATGQDPGAAVLDTSVMERLQELQELMSEPELATLQAEIAQLQATAAEP